MKEELPELPTIRNMPTDKGAFDLDKVDLKPWEIRALVLNGIFSLANLAGKSDAELLQLPNVSSRLLRKLKVAMSVQSINVSSTHGD